MSRTAAKSSAHQATSLRKETPERAIAALPVPQSDFKLGGRVAHPKFGNGVVKVIDGDKLTIQFARNITKQIVDYYVKHRTK